MGRSKKDRGYVAIITVLVIGAVALVVGVGVVLNGINEMQTGFSESKKETALNLVNACAKDGMLRLNKNGSIPATIVLPEGSCSVTINSQLGNAWDVTFAGTFGEYAKSIRVTATKTSSVTINTWLEI